MAVLSKSSIISGSKVEAWHVTQSIDAFTGVKEYDITLSGSLTLTGSLNFGIIPNNILGTSSNAYTSSYSDYAEAIEYAVTTSAAANETVILQFYHSPVDITANTIYYLGGGILTKTGSFDAPNNIVPAGIPVSSRGTIVNAVVTTTNKSTGSIESTLSLGINNEKAYDFILSAQYSSSITQFRESIDINVQPGDIISFSIFTDPSGTLPTETIHNINLYINVQ
jgi:hypothetical protein